MSSSDYADVAQEYNRRAPFYDQHWQFYIEASVKETMTHLSLPSPCKLLDLGCGTGSLIGMILERWPSVKTAGVDVSLGMLQVARHKLGGHVVFACADGHHLPFTDKSFDVVVSATHFIFKENRTSPG